MPAVVFTLLTLALLALPGPAQGATRPDRWLEARSPHFVVISNGGEEQARRVSRQFERVRALLRGALASGRDDLRDDPRDPVVVLAVNKEDSLRELLPQFWERKGQRPVAAYWGGPYRHHIVLRVDASDRERDRRVLHEYVHMLTHANIPDLPAWLDEGLSEFWGTALVEDEAVEIGRPAARHLKVLRARRSWIPLDELLAMERAPDARDSQRLSLFYAQSWALIHYVMLGGSSTALELAPSNYVGRLGQGASPVEAGALAFGNVSQLERALTAYVHAGRFRAVRMEIPQPQGAPADQHEGVELRIRALSPAESLAVRAGFLVDGERPAAALPLLAEALRLDPTETSVLEALGCFHFQQNNPVEAARWFDRAIESGSASHLAYFYRAILAGPAPGLVAGEDVVRAEGLLRRAIDLNAEFAPAYVQLADLYGQSAGRMEEALSLMRRATELEPDNAAYWVDRGRLLLRLHRVEEAQAAGQQGLAVVRAASARELVEAFLREFEPATRDDERPGQ